MSKSSSSPTTDGANVADADRPIQAIETIEMIDTIESTEVRPPPRVAAPRRSPGDAALITILVLVVWLTVVFLGRVWGIELEDEGRRLILYTPPVLGGYRQQLPVSLVVPVAIAVAMIVALPILARRLRWRATLLMGTVGALVWWIALALVDGIDGLTAGLAWSSEMAQVQQAVTAHPRSWLSSFTAGVINDGIQTRAHPPGLPLLLALMNRWGMPGSGWAVAACLGFAAAAVPAVLITVRELAGEQAARRVLPFVVLSPAAIWIATSFDALFMGVAAWYVALVVMACRRRGPTADACAVGAGLAAAVTIEMSYGLILMGCIAVAVAISTRTWRPLIISSVTALLPTLCLLPFGFWWVSGLGATRQAYYALGLDRPYSYFLFADLSVLAIVVGPAVAVALTRRLPRGLLGVVLGAGTAMVIADLSGLSTGEVERIWLPFAIWLTPAAVALTGGERPWAVRGWLVLQVASALVLTAFVRTFW